MTHEQLCAHLALQGWAAWVEHGYLFNITHPQRGTVWCTENDPDSPKCDRQYKYFHAMSTPCDMVTIPPDVLRAMEAKIPWLDLEEQWDE